MEIIKIFRDGCNTECFRARRDAILAITRFDHYENETRLGGGVRLMTAGGEITLEDVDYEDMVKKLGWHYL